MNIFKYVYLAYLTTSLSLDIESISNFLPSQIILYIFVPTFFHASMTVSLGINS